MEINKSNVSEIVRKCGLNPNKNLGQNFLSEPDVCKRITSLISPKQEEKVLEIGPGLGSLTHYMSSYDLTAVDIDDRMIDFLKVLYQDNSNIKFVRQDILKHDVSQYDYIIGNLPYYITTEVITNLILKANKAKKMVFMVQKEAFTRFSAKVNQDGYSPIAILISYLGIIKKEFLVGQSNFYPNPHVDSLVFSIEIDLNNRTSRNLGAYKLAKQLFLNKRKTIQNNLTNLIKSKEAAITCLNNLNIEPNTRPEQIEAHKYLEIYDYLVKEGKIKE